MNQGPGPKDGDVPKPDPGTGSSGFDLEGEIGRVLSRPDGLAQPAPPEPQTPTGTPALDLEYEVGEMLASPLPLAASSEPSQPEQASEPAQAPRRHRRSRIFLLTAILLVVVGVALSIGLLAGDEGGEPSDTQAAAGASAQEQEVPVGTTGEATVDGDGDAPDSDSPVADSVDMSTDAEAGQDGYAEALAALGLDVPQTTTSGYRPDSSQVSGLGTWAFAWVDASGAAVAEMGDLLFAKSEDGAGTGSVTMPGSDAVGAYQVGMAEGAITVDFALRVPTPAGGDEALVVFHCGQNEPMSLTGWAERRANGSITKLELGVAGTQVAFGAVDSGEGAGGE